MVVVVELVHLLRSSAPELRFQSIARSPVAGDFGRSLEAEARGLHEVVDLVSALLMAIVPHLYGFVDLTVDGQRDFLIPLAHGGGF